MFTSPTKENETGEIEIKDFGINTMKSLINFLYSGKVADDMTKLAECYTPELLAAADMYGVLDLKAIVSQHLLKYITVDNAIDSLTYAYHHNAEDLRKEAVTFVFKNMDAVMTKPEWKELHSKHPVVSTDLLEVAFGKKKLQDAE